MKGTFELDDESITKWEIDDDDDFNWNQWGNSTENLRKTVDLISKMAEFWAEANYSA